MSAEIQFQVTVDPTVVAASPDLITFETGASFAETADPDAFAYEHHGPEFVCRPSALVRFADDLLFGRPLPIAFGTHSVRDIDTITAIALFLQRDLALASSLPAFIAQVDFVHRHGVPAFGHLDADVGKFLQMLKALFPPNIGRRETGERIGLAVSWIRDYLLESRLPTFQPTPETVRVIDKGTGGFVLAEASGDLLDAWVSLFRKGHLRGVLVSQERDCRRRVLASRKSLYVPFDLSSAAQIFNAMETAMGEPPEWKCAGNWLYGPENGTLILVSHLLEIFLRV